MTEEPKNNWEGVKSLHDDLHDHLISHEYFVQMIMIKSHVQDNHLSAFLFKARISSYLKVHSQHVARI